MKNLKITLGTLLLTLSVNYTMAQSIEEKATAQTEQMDNQLGLASDQKAKIEELNLAIFSKNEAIKNDPNMSETLKKQSTEGNNAARMDMLREVLTPEQYEMYEKSQAQPTINMKIQTQQINTTRKKQEIAPAE